MARNRLAGTTTGKSESAKYFAANPEARKKKRAYDKKYNARKDKKDYRVELNRENRQKGTYGKMTAMGKDRSHTKDGRMVLEDRKRNRQRNGKDGKSTKKG
jgi:hypothetical protein